MKRRTRTLIYSAGASASEADWARSQEPDLKFFAALTPRGELATLEYHAQPQISAFRLQLDHDSVGRLQSWLGHIDEDRHRGATNDRRFTKIWDEAALPFAAEAVGPENILVLGPAPVERGMEGEESRPIYMAAARWCFDVNWYRPSPEVSRSITDRLKEHLCTAPFKVLRVGPAGEIEIGIGGHPGSVSVERALRADARAAFNRLKESQYAQQ